jgi:hypothetical protein
MLTKIQKQGYGIVPKSLIYSENLTSDAKIIYGYIATYADKNDTAFPSELRIMRYLKIGKKRITFAIKLLEKYDFIAVSREKRHNVYTLKADKSKGYGLLPKSVMEDENLSIKAKFLYMVHVAFAGNFAKNCLDSGRIIDYIGVSERSYYKYQRELVEKNYLTAEQRYDLGNHRFGVNNYYLSQEPIPENVNIKLKNIAVGILNSVGDFVYDKVTSFVKGVKNFDKKVYKNTYNSTKLTVSNVPLQIKKISPPTGTRGAELIENNDLSYAEYRDIIGKNIEYDWFSKSTEFKTKFDRITELLELGAEMCVAKSVKIGNTFYTADVVRSRILSLNFTHIEYILDSLEKTTTDIKSIDNYLKTCLFKSVVTIGHYYDQEAKKRYI